LRRLLRGSRAQLRLLCLRRWNFRQFGVHIELGWLIQRGRRAEHRGHIKHEYIRTLRWKAVR